MSDIPTPKYHLGSVVYHPITEQVQQTLPCPDCLGKREWTAVSPAGETHTVACPRCTGQYAHSGNDKLPSLRIMRLVGAVRRLTIGSIRINTHPSPHGEEKVEYMATETGVGSGGIYRESTLFADESIALEVANARAGIENAKIDLEPRVIEARRFSGLTYTSAASMMLKDNIFNAWAAFRNLSYAIENWLPDESRNDNEEQAQLREEWERYARYSGTTYPPEKHPIDELIAAFEKAGGKDLSAEINEAIGHLKSMAGLDDRPEPPECICQYPGKYSRDPKCPRHGNA